MNGSDAGAAMPGLASLRGADRWVADRIEYLRVPDFLDAGECNRLIALALATPRGRQSVLDGTRDPWLAEIDARLCSMAGFAPGTGGPLRVLYLDAGAEAPPAVAADESSWRCKVSIYLNDIESAGELCLGRSACVLRPRCGTTLIAKRTGAGAWDPRSEPSEMPVRAGFKAVLTKNFSEPAAAVRADPARLPLQRCRMPDGLFMTLRAFHEGQSGSAVDEHVPGYIENELAIPSRLLQLPEALQHEVHATLQPIVERWSQRALAPTFVYGIRRYLRGTTLKMHRDRLGTHVYGVSLNVAQQVEDPWPLVIEDAPGHHREVLLQPGEMVLYESQRLLHGRPRALRGDFYAGVFAHFRPCPAPP
jgi:prolyl 4-hydroxylase